jgi:3-oxoacyl-[acyl-carrier protein] reductase
MRLKEQVAVVTGAGRGIGRATALALADEGAAVALIARSSGELAEVAKEIRGRRDGGGAERAALAVPCDVTDEEQVEGMIARVLEEFGRIDVLVNNAGFNQVGLVEETPLARWQEILAVNTTGTFLCSRAVLPTMRRQGGGRIVNVVSGAGKRGSATRGAYSAAKFGVIGFSQALQLEVKGQGITVSCVSPGPVATKLRAQNAPGEDPSTILQPEDVAEAIVFVATRPERVIIPELEVRPRSAL